jgi:hypothetical protein
MNSIKLSTTAQTPSAFGMPTYGHAFGATTVCGAGIATSIVRDRRSTDVQGAVKGAMGLALATFPGTTAWRPPTC